MKRLKDIISYTLFGLFINIAFLGLFLCWLIFGYPTSANAASLNQGMQGSLHDDLVALSACQVQTLDRSIDPTNNMCPGSLAFWHFYRITYKQKESCRIQNHKNYFLTFSRFRFPGSLAPLPTGSTRTARTAFTKSTGSINAADITTGSPPDHFLFIYTGSKMQEHTSMKPEQHSKIIEPDQKNPMFSFR